MKKITCLFVLFLLLTLISSCGGNSGNGGTQQGGSVNSGGIQYGQPLTISVPGSQNARAGETVTVPLNLSNMDGICGLDITMKFDGTILAAKDIELTAASTGFLSQKSITPNSIRVVLAGKNSMNATGKLENNAVLNVLFNVGPVSPGSHSSIILENPRLYDTNASPVENLSVSNGNIVIQ